MAINLKNARAEELLKELAEKTGETLTEAATRSFEARLAQLTANQEQQRARKLSLLRAIVADARKHRPADDPGDKATMDELWGEP